MTAPDGVLALVHESATNRATCGTAMNRTSSRSHAMLLLRVEQWNESPEEAAAEVRSRWRVQGAGYREEAAAEVRSRWRVQGAGCGVQGGGGGRGA